MRNNPFARLRLRLVLWYAGIFTLILLVSGTATYLFLARQLLGGVDDMNRLASTTLLGSLGNKDVRLAVGRSQFLAQRDEIRDVYGVALIQVYDPVGRLITRTYIGFGPVPPAGPPVETAQRGGLAVRLQRSPILRGGRLQGTLIVGRPMSQVDETLRELLATQGAIIGLALLATLAAGAFLSGKAIRPIRSAFEQQRQFIADVSHELRTPLSVIQTQTETALQAPLPDPALAEGLGVIDRTVRQMGRLVSDLLLLSRADAATLRLERHPYYLNELLEELAADFRPLAQLQGLTLLLEGEGRDVLLQGDPEKIRQLLANLVENAIKYTGAPGEVRIVLQAADREAIVSVADSGPGIPPEDLPRIFDRFYRADGSRAARQGTGLGLAIARTIAVAHGGQLKVKSAPGRGSTFQLHLPRPD